MPPTEPERDRLAVLEKEFDTYRRQKCRRVGGVEPLVLQNLAMYVGEQWVWFERGSLKNRNPKRDDQGRITEVNLVLNLIEPAFDDIYGRLTASSPEFRAFPDTRDAAKMAKAEVVSMAIQSANERLDEDYLRWQRWFWMMFGGVAIEHTPYRRNLEVQPVEKKIILDIDGEELPLPVWKHIPTGEEMPDPQRVAMIESQQALPEHFEPATELALDGDFDAEIRGPLNVFNPNSVQTFAQLQPGQSVMFADIRLLSWAKKTWPDADFSDFKGQENFKVLTTRVSEQISFTNTSLHDLIPVIQGSASEDDPEMILCVERYEPVSDEYPPGWSLERGASTGRGFVKAPSESFANGGRYTVFCPELGVLRDGEIPYSDGIPATDLHWSVSAHNFYGPAWATKLCGPQKSINTLASQMRQRANARIFDPILMDDDLVPPETDQPRYWPGAFNSDTGSPRASRLGGDEMPAAYANQLQQLVEVFDRLAGTTELFQQPKFPGQIRGTGAVQILQDVMDSKWGPRLRHYYTQMSKIHHRRVNRMKQFYPPVKTMRMMDSTGKVEVFRFHTDEILRAGVDYFISVEPSSILPETRRERFARMTEMLSGPLAGLWMDEETGAFNWTDIAAELQFGDYKGREALLAQEIKFAQGVIEAIKTGQQVPPIIGVENHAVFLRELRRVMADDDFWQILSPETRQALFNRYQEHGQALQQAAQRQQQAAIDEQTADLVRQAVQQSLAKMQSEVTEAVLAGVRNLAYQDPESLQALLYTPRSEQ